MIADRRRLSIVPVRPRTSVGHALGQLVISLHRLHRSAGGDPHRAILELGNLPEWIERGIGQQVGGRLVIAEWNEYRAPRRAVIAPRIERNAASARRDRDRGA